jgi:hypothetical protein
MDWKEACQILGVSESATDAEIKEQYMYKAQLLHPDKNQDKPETVRKKAESELALINQAYTFLINPNNNPYKIPPRLAIEPMGIRFKDVKIGEKKRTTLIIRNAGGPYTSIWIDNNPAPWLTIAAVKSITTERLPLEVTLEGTGSGEPDKTYSCDLLIKLENEITHIVDSATVKIELCTVSGSTEPVPPKAQELPVNVPTAAASPVKQPIGTDHKLNGGFSLGAFLIDIFSFAVIGAIAFFIVKLFFPEIAMYFAFTFALILYSALALCISIIHGFRVGSKPKNPRITN